MHRFLATVALVSLAHAANADETLDKLTAFLEQHGVFEQVVTKDTGEKTTNTYRQSIVVDEGKLLIEIETRTTRPSVGAFGTYFPNHKIQTWETHPCEIFGYEDKGKIRFRGNSYSIESHLFRLSFFAARQELIDLDKSVEDTSFVMDEKGPASADFYLKHSPSVVADFLKLVEDAQDAAGCERKIEKR